MKNQVIIALVLFSGAFGAGMNPGFPVHGKYNCTVIHLSQNRQTCREIETMLSKIQNPKLRQFFSKMKLHFYSLFFANKTENFQSLSTRQFR